MQGEQKEELREFAGNLKAELLEARHELDHGKMGKEEFLHRVKVIRGRREFAMARYNNTGVLFTQQAAAQ